MFSSETAFHQCLHSTSQGAGSGTAHIRAQYYASVYTAPPKPQAVAWLRLEFSDNYLGN